MSTADKMLISPCEIPVFPPQSLADGFYAILAKQAFGKKKARAVFPEHEECPTPTLAAPPRNF